MRQATGGRVACDGTSECVPFGREAGALGRRRLDCGLDARLPAYPDQGRAHVGHLPQQVSSVLQDSESVSLLLHACH